MDSTKNEETTKKPGDDGGDRVSQDMPPIRYCIIIYIETSINNLT